MPQQIPWGKLYSSPQQQVGALFYKVASVLGTPGGKDYSVRSSTDFPELPQPSDDLEILQRDFLRWGYCLVKDALDKNEVARATDRLLDQAEAERTAKVAQMGARQNNGPSWTGSRQLVSNLASKGEVWRDIATYQTHNGPLIEAILTAALGKGMLLSSMHGVVVEQGAGAQGIHQDQSFPLPHPPFPTHCNIIYMYTDWSLENGGTYVVPGTAIDSETGNCIVTEAVVSNADDAVEFVRAHKYGIVALTAPAGTCFVSDGRVLHAGAPRIAPGQRLGNNCYHCRAEMKQQENPYVSYCYPLEKTSKRLKQLLFGSGAAEVGFGQRHRQPSGTVPVGEQTLTSQDFDFYYTRMAESLAKETDGATAMFKGTVAPVESKL